MLASYLKRLWFYWLMALAFAAQAQAGALTITLLDNATGNVAEDTEITAYRILADGSREWVTRKNTDNNGQLQLELENIESGTQFQFKTRAFNATDLYSDIITETSTYTFVAGQKLVYLKNGADASHPPLTEHKVTLKAVKEDGGLQWLSSATSDANGVVRFNPSNPELSYVFAARSTLTNEEKRTAITSATGPLTFVVGNQALNINLSHGITGAAIAGQRIEARRIEADGSTSWAGRQESDGNGQAVFDLEGLGNGSEYELKTYNAEGFFAKRVVSATGNLNFPFGNARVTILNGREQGQPILPENRVTLYEQSSAGLNYLFRATSDNQGQVLLDLPGLTSSQTYVAKVRIDDKDYTANITQTGDSSAVFGKLPQLLKVTLNNTATSQPIVGMRLEIRDVTEEPSRHYKTLETDANGQIRADIQGFYENRQYQVRFKPFDGDRIVSDVIENPAELTFNLHLEPEGFTVNLLDGTQTSLTPITDSRVDVYRLVGEEKHWYTRKNSDANGQLTFTLPDLEKGQQYVLKTNHTQTNRGFYSAPLTGNQTHDFVVGYQPTQVTVVNPVTGEALVNTRVDVRRQRDDQSWYTEKTAYSDNNGQVLFHLSELNAERPALLKATSADGFRDEMNIDSTGEHQFPLGNTQLTIFNGRVEGTPLLTDTRVNIYRLTGDEREKISHANTNENGQVLLALPQLQQGQQYQAVVNIERKNYESLLPGLGGSEHVFGKLPQMLNITLNNTRTNQPIADMRISIRDVTEEQSTYFASLTSNENGFASIDVQGFYEERKYQVQVRPFDGESIYSDVLSVAGDVVFDIYYDEDGLPVTLLDGSQAGQPPLAGKRIDVYKVIGGETKWYTRQDTDENGMAHFKLADLDIGQQYVLRSYSEINDVKRYSEPFGDVESLQFVLGNLPVNVTLVDVSSNTLVSDFQIEARLKQEDGSFKYYQRATTNAQGVAQFDLDGFETGAVYQFKARYLTTGDSYSQPISSIQDVEFRVATVPVQLIDIDSNAAIANVRIDANWLDEDNKTRWGRRGDTDAQGNVVFDLDRLKDGTRYVLKARNPFGEDKTYYGPILYNEGAVQFIVKQGEYGNLDLADPEVFITSPTRDNVNGIGFLLGGVATDDNGIARVEVSISDPVKGTTSGNATLLDNEQWQFAVPESAISVDEQISVTVTAFDSALNSISTERVFNVVSDMAAPVITIVSHDENDNVNETGFTILGTASDDTGTVQVLASLTDPILGTTIEAQSVSVAEDGQWALIVTNGKVSGGQTISLNLSAIDSSDKTTDIALNLNVQTIVPQQQQLISRITFGMTPELYVNQPDAATFLAQQLAPQSIDDSEVENAAQSWVLEEIDDLKGLQLHYMLYSRRQLNEVMTWFWENHFNTHFGVHRNLAYEVAENQGFRQHALGNFRDILAVSAKSPAMIYYLNNAQNFVGRANENYAREIMELHTLGVDGGYSADDVAELSKIFTGWHEQNGAFFFNEEAHDFTDKNLLGVNIPGSGLQEGESALDILASHPNTARNLCRKFITLFISDSEVSSLQGQCEGEFLLSGGNIASVLTVLFGSDEFVALEHQGNKIKTPLEVLLAAVRSVNATPDYYEMARTLSRMGYSLFEFPVPTGLAETGPAWLSSDALLQRIRFANRFALEGREGASVDLQQLLIAMGYSSADAIVGLIADLTLNGRLTDLERDVAIALLNENIAEGESFNINAPDAPDKLQRLLGTMLSYPAFQYQ